MYCQVFNRKMIHSTEVDLEWEKTKKEGKGVLLTKNGCLQNPLSNYGGQLWQLDAQR
jgi:hypothetical protein